MIPALRKLKHKEELQASMGYMAKLALGTDIKSIKKEKENTAADFTYF